MHRYREGSARAEVFPERHITYDELMFEKQPRQNGCFYLLSSFTASDSRDRDIGTSSTRCVFVFVAVLFLKSDTNNTLP